MAYNWAQLAFVEKWRHYTVRGQIVGMYRPEDRTFFDLRLRPGEGNVGQLPGPVEIHLVDVGDLIREKRIALLDRVAVVVRIVASTQHPSTPPAESVSSPAKRVRPLLQPGSRISGRIVVAEGDAMLLDAGLPIVVHLEETEASKSLQLGQSTELTVIETPKGFFVL